MGAVNFTLRPDIEPKSHAYHQDFLLHPIAVITHTAHSNM